MFGHWFACFLRVLLPPPPLAKSAVRRSRGCGATVTSRGTPTDRSSLEARAAERDRQTSMMTSMATLNACRGVDLTPAPWRVTIAGCYSTVKAGNAEEECEDAWSYGNPPLAFAIADGATESSFSREWATRLVEDFVARSPWLRDGETAIDLAAWLEPLQHQWAAWIASQDLRWYARRKTQEGTFAAFLGLTFDRDCLQWRAVAVGDACLFVVRDGQLLHSFPLSRDSEFGYRPRLIGTLGWTELSHSIRYLCAAAAVGDRFYLATDALAAWILSRVRMGETPWVELDRIEDSAAFARWVADLRARDEVANDDMTLLHLAIAA